MSEASDSPEEAEVLAWRGLRPGSVPSGCAMIWLGLLPGLAWGLGTLSLGGVWSGELAAFAAWVDRVWQDSPPVVLGVFGGWLFVLLGLGVALLYGALTREVWLRAENGVRIRTWTPIGGWTERAVEGEALRATLEARAANPPSPEGSPPDLLAALALERDATHALEERLRADLGLAPLPPLPTLAPAWRVVFTSPLFKVAAAAWLLFAPFAHALPFRREDPFWVGLTGVFVGSTALALTLLVLLWVGVLFASWLARCLDPVLTRLLGWEREDSPHP